MRAPITAFFNVATCSMIDSYQHYAHMLPLPLGVCSIFHPEDWGSRFVQNISTYVHGVTCCKTDLTTASQVVSAVCNVNRTLTACREHDCETDSCRTVGLTVLCVCAAGESQQEQQEEVAHSFDWRHAEWTEQKSHGWAGWWGRQLWGRWPVQHGWCMEWQASKKGNFCSPLIVVACDKSGGTDRAQNCVRHT